METRIAMALLDAAAGSPDDPQIRIDGVGERFYTHDFTFYRIFGDGREYAVNRVNGMWWKRPVSSSHMYDWEPLQRSPKEVEHEST